MSGLLTQQRLCGKLLFDFTDDHLVMLIDLFWLQTYNLIVTLITFYIPGSTVSTGFIGINMT